LSLFDTKNTFDSILNFFYQVDKIVDQLQTYVTSYDLANLRDYWNFLNSRLFSRLEQRFMTSVRKLEVGLLKYYLVYAAQNNKQDKILEFFDRMTDLLQTQSEFKEWFGKVYFALLDLTPLLNCILLIHVVNVNAEIHNLYHQLMTSCSEINVLISFPAFPFVRVPRDNSHFSLYFTQQWQDTFFLSLHNFLSVILQAMHILYKAGYMSKSYVNQ